MKKTAACVRREHDNATECRYFLLSNAASGLLRPRPSGVRRITLLTGFGLIGSIALIGLFAGFKVASRGGFLVWQWPGCALRELHHGIDRAYLSTANAGYGPFPMALNQDGIR